MKSSTFSHVNLKLLKLQNLKVNLYILHEYEISDVW